MFSGAPNAHRTGMEHLGWGMHSVVYVVVEGGVENWVLLRVEERTVSREGGEVRWKGYVALHVRVLTAT